MFSACAALSKCSSEQMNVVINERRDSRLYKWSASFIATWCVKMRSTLFVTDRELSGSNMSPSASSNSFRSLKNWETSLSRSSLFIVFNRNHRSNTDTVSPTSNTELVSLSFPFFASSTIVCISEAPFSRDSSA